MTAVVCWKEYRQQRWIWVTIVGLGTLLIFATAEAIGRGGFWQVFHEQEVRSVLWTMVMCLGLAYGVVCGALLLASEKEDDTQTYLDRLSPKRGPVWHAKLRIGVLLTLTQATVLSCLGVILGFLSWRWAVLVPMLSLAALASGLLGGAMYRRVLPAVLTGTGFLAAGLLGPLLFSAGWGFLAIITVLGVAAAHASWKVYSTEDRTRDTALMPHSGRVISSRRALDWLMWQQGRWVLIPCLIGCVVVGLVLRLAPLILWPIGTWLIGLICGLAVFAGDQGGGQNFWGNQRLPLGRIWAGKIVFWGSAAVLVAAVFWGVSVGLLLFVDTYFERYTGERGYWFNQWREQGLGLLTAQLDPVTFLTLWLSYGFAFGQFFSLVWRRSITGAILAVAIGGFFVLAWAPSVFAGGLHAWQVLPIALLLLVASRLAMRPWAAGRLYSARPMAWIVVAGIVSSAWLAGNLHYRVAEVPDVPEPFDRNAFLASIPAGENARRLFNEAAHDLAAHLRHVEARLGPRAQPLAAEKHDKKSPTASRVDLLEAIQTSGWPKKDAEIAAFLDLALEGRWVKKVEEMLELPPAPLLDLRVMSWWASPLPAHQECRMMALLFASRSCQVQARGDHSGALEQLNKTLALSRRLRYHAPGIGVVIGQAVENIALTRWQGWLNELGPKRKLLRQAIDILEDHRARMPPATDAIKAEAIVFQNSWPFVENHSTQAPRRPEERFLRDLEQMPWEKERHSRLFAALLQGQLHRLELPYWEVARAQQEGTGHAHDWIARYQALPPASGPGGELTESQWGRLIRASSQSYAWTMLFSLDPYRQAASQRSVRAALIATALTLYQAGKSKSAMTLTDLTPQFLKEVPIDPVIGKSFQFRISKGEEFAGFRFTDRHNLVKQRLQPGEGLLWTDAPEISVPGSLPASQRVCFATVPAWKRHD